MSLASDFFPGGAHQRGVSGEPRPPSARDRWKDDVASAAARYSRTPRPHRFYASIKYRTDPLYRQVCELLGRRERVIDLGTGLGMLPVILAVREQVGKVVGVDWDKSKLASGRLASVGMDGIELVHADIRSYLSGEESADAVVMGDVLHYFPLEEQVSLVRRAAKALRQGGRLVVRDTDRRERSMLTQRMEVAAMRMGWNRGAGLTYGTRSELRAWMESAGLRSGEGEGSSSLLHRGNVIAWADRP